jgi:NADH-quinone oxidoreductase subunit L
MGKVFRAVREKLYIDELYDLIVVRPFRWVSQRLFDVVDRFLIDLVLVEGSAAVVDVVGRLARWFQNGYVQRYLVAVLVGAAAIVYLASRTPADFRYQVVAPLTVEFEADAGAGPGAQNASVQWDFDGDGQVDSTGARATHPFPEARSYDVTMWLTDGVFGKTRKVTKSVAVGGGES